MKSLRRIFSIIATLFLIMILALAGWLTYAIQSPMPQVTGNIKAIGLINPVDVYRDQWGVPQIYAQNPHDLFFTQGYVQAQDRFWQMESSRRLFTGRLAELFGPDLFSVDRYVRTFGLKDVVKKEYEQLDDKTKIALDAYSAGVNAYMDTHSQLGLAITLLGVQGIHDVPDHWTPYDVLLWFKGTAWNLDGNMYSELSRVALIQKAGLDAMQEIRPAYPQNYPVIVPAGVSYEKLKLGGLKSNMDFLRSLSKGQGSGLGSNSWAIAGNHTDTGKPYLADDPHLGIQMPSIWYEIGLHCLKISKECPYDVVGVSFPGVPGVAIGHNQRIAWGFTNLGADVQDLYVERVNPANHLQYEVNGKWVNMKVAKETIYVHGKFQPPAEDATSFETSYDATTGFTKVVVPIYTTRHGPILDRVDPQVGELKGAFGAMEIPTQHAISFRWVALEPNNTMQAILELDQAQDFAGFRNALSHFDDPTQNIIYADIDGNIGYQTPGKIPIRAHGDGLLPVPGWTDEYEWQGYIPFDKLPTSYNPPEGYVVAANNAVVGPDYPYLISLEWDPGTRAKRIIALISAHKTQPFTRDDMIKMQADTLDLTAQEMIAYLKPLHYEDKQMQQALDSLRAWGFKADPTSGPAALYGIFWVDLVKTAFEDQLAVTEWPNMEAVNRLLKNPDSHWWDDTSTPGIIEKRDDVLRKAFAAAYGDAVKAMGSNPSAWQWGKLHTATFHESSLGYSGIAPIEAMFNRGPYPFPGSMATINATFWWIYSAPDASDPNVYSVVSMPSMRTIVDLKNLQNSIIINSTGQSGHPFNSHYDDMIGPWLRNQYHPELWDQTTIKTTRADHLLFTP